MRLEGVVESVRRESWRSLVCWGSESGGSVEEAFGRGFSYGTVGGLRCLTLIVGPGAPGENL